MKKFLTYLFFLNPRLFVRILYGNIWKLRERILKNGRGYCRSILYDVYWESLGSFVGIEAEFEDVPIFPHGPLGIFISNSAHIGKKCVIFQQVTIGSNMIKGSKMLGAPTLGDNVYVGCGAKIIGNVHVGENARIGANAVIVKDVPANSVTIIRGVESIIREEKMDNEYIVNPYQRPR